MVALTAYAPLFNHVDYTSWTPDLIAYNNHAAYGIPFYHALCMLSGSRGDQVLAVDVDSPEAYEDLQGLTGIVSSGAGVQIRNMRCNGIPVTPTHNIVSELREDAGVYTAWETDNSELMRSPGLSVREVLNEVKSFGTFGEEEVRTTLFEAELLLEDPSVKTSIAFWIHNNTMLHNQDETRCVESKLWTPIYTNRYVWSLENYEGYLDAITRSRYSWRGPRRRLKELVYGSWMNIRVEAEHEVTVLTGENPEMVNDFEHPLAVVPVTRKERGAAEKEFVCIVKDITVNGVNS